MTYSEIGSEFWIADNGIAPVNERDGLFVLSGRTAIDLILQDILKHKSVKNVYMPAYCCDSMIAPFRQRNIRVDFYDMFFDGQLKYEIDAGKNADILYVSNYFGYENTLSDELIHHFKENGSIILYDRTHAFLMDNSDLPDADYTFVSLRKWMGVATGAKVKGLNPVKLSACPYTEAKAQAMRAKYQYLNGDSSVEKTSFLEAFACFGKQLEQDYRNYGMDDLSYALYKAEDLVKMRARRRTNAAFLHENLQLDFLGQLTEEACPLFVPVVFDIPALRDKVRKALIEARIYCPVHWPKNSLITADMKVNRLFYCELSLICDQRYGLEEMSYIVQKIQESI
ncbi:MAG: hypothetical protein J5644_10850 [Bacteroidales bacterium]|nr:hypothetical protein [Bacteroidales bacterium]